MYALLFRYMYMYIPVHLYTSTSRLYIDNLDEVHFLAKHYRDFVYIHHGNENNGIRKLHNCGFNLDVILS